MKLILLLSLFVLIGHSNPSTIYFYSNDVLAYQIDHTIEGAVVRMTRFFMDNILVHVAAEGLPLRKHISAPQFLIDKVVDMCNYSFDCKMDDDYIVVNKRIFIKV